MTTDVLRFNTGRPYSADGQPITAIHNQQAQVLAFVDYGRNIRGIMENISWTKFDQKEIMRRYDNFEYLDYGNEEHVIYFDYIELIDGKENS